jgi:chromosome segregation protein
MLNLERMELCGFKSFSDRTEIRFPSGITAIVGPNGCGKSNLGDAINWVLGEQSAKLLRGRQMADVIFNGSESRKPVGMAEVSLVFQGAEGLPHHDQGRLTITRRLFRSGESEYRINGARTRLMDIQDVLRQARVGARTYATIEQGRIEQVLNAKPRERRALIEDAAGIAGYKHKRRLAELKLEATQANLLRVNDIVTEVQRQINSLKRQAAKARRYRRLREELRERELLRFARQTLDADRELDRLRGEERSARDLESQAAAQLAAGEARLAERRAALDTAGLAIREASEGLHRRQIEIDRAEARIRTCRERIGEVAEAARQRAGQAESIGGKRDAALARRREQAARAADVLGELERLTAELSAEQQGRDAAEQELRGLREELEQLRKRQFESVATAAELRNRLRSTEEAMERGGVRRSRLEAERAAARSAGERAAVALEEQELALAAQRQAAEERQREAAAAELALRGVRAQLGADLAALAAAREREQAVRERCAALEDLETRFTGVYDGVKTLLASAGASGIRTHGVVADYVEASRDVEGAAESYLLPLLPTVIVEDDADARRAAELLRTSGAGRTSILCRNHPAGGFAVGGNGHPELPREILDDRRVIGRLRERLTLRASANGAVSSRIGDAVLVDDLATALDLHRRFPSADYVTTGGEVVYASGVVSAGGRPLGDQGLLAHQRRRQELQRETSEAGAATAALEAAVATGRTGLEQLEGEAARARRELEAAQLRSVELDLGLARSREERERIARQGRVLEEELASLAAEVDPLHETLAHMASEAALAERSQRALGEAVEELSRRLREAEQAHAQRLERAAAVGAERAARAEQHEALRLELQRLDADVAELSARIEALAAEGAAADDRARGAGELIEKTESELALHLDERRRTEERFRLLEQEISREREELAAGEGELRELRGGADALRERAREAALSRARAEAAREHLDDLCRQELGVGAAEAATSCGAAAAEVDLAELDASLAEVRNRIEDLGPVNMTAIEEFTELEERHAFLTAQRTDLDQSMESLRETIRRINRQSRQRFAEAFESIRLSFQEVYRLLFSGGRADLRLEEGEDDVLEAGIEILAQPPGKRLAGVHLLSGGEKALSAIALLFAIFRYRPSPFCVLDEVDAALDDSNVARFNRMVGEYAQNTQFVVVTHNKLSMETANLLYGVTMEEPGVSKVVSLQLH